MENLEQQPAEMNEEQLKTTEVDLNAYIKQLEEERSKTLKENEELMQAMNEVNERVQRDQEQIQREQNKMMVCNELDKRELGAFVEVFDTIFDNVNDKDSLLQKVDAIEQVVNNILVSKSFVPKETAQQDAYNQAIAAGNVNQALTHKLGKFFGIK